MTSFIEKSGEVKEVQTEDLVQYYAKGWKDSEKKPTPASFVRRGKKRDVTEDIEESKEIEE